MYRQALNMFAACAAFALAASATLSAAELTHRWSFNGDWSDSAGGADAAKCGTYVSLYGGRVHMGYGACSHGTGYVDLGTNMLDTEFENVKSERQRIHEEMHDNRACRVCGGGCWRDSSAVRGRGCGGGRTGGLYRLAWADVRRRT